MFLALLIVRVQMLTFFLKKSLSSRVRVSALAMTGTMFTTLLRRLINSTSKGLKLKERAKYIYTV